MKSDCQKKPPPRFITKYFELKDRKYYSRGSIKFGCLTEYRNVENAAYMGARMDLKEGVLEREYNLHEPFFDDVVVPGIGRIGVGAKHIIFRGNVVRQVFNERVFCASAGDYTPEQHASICGGFADYSGNPKLLCYAVFNLERLLRALHSASRAHPEFEVEEGEGFLIGGFVEYSKRPVEINLFGEKVVGPNIFDWVSYQDSIYKKPPFFAPENEFRIALRMNAPFLTAAEAKPIFLESKDIFNSIAKMGP